MFILFLLSRSLNYFEDTQIENSYLNRGKGIDREFRLNVLELQIILHITPSTMYHVTRACRVLHL